MKKIIGLIIVLITIGFILHLGGTTPQDFSKSIEAKDPTYVFQPLLNKLGLNKAPTLETKETNKETKEVVVANIVPNGIVPRESVPTVSKDEIVEKEYVIKITPKEENKSYYEKLFKEAKEDEQFFPYKDEEKPTFTYVKLNQTSIERNYGNQQSFDKDPYGWNKNKQVDIPHSRLGNYHGWFWNRSHLVADQLGGDSTPRNSITGTRTQNVGGRDNKGGMRMPEERAYLYVKETKKPLLYFVDVVYYDEKNTIPNEVRITLYNDEVYEQYITYNVANGFNIDYQKATFVKE